MTMRQNEASSSDCPEQHSQPTKDSVDVEPSRISEGFLVELAKLRAAPHPAVEPGSWDSYRIGSSNAGSSLPVSYALVGILLEAPQAGRPVRILRLERNGIKALGLFESSPVIRLTANGFTTQNSVYRLQALSSGLPQPPSASSASN